MLVRWKVDEFRLRYGTNRVCNLGVFSKTSASTEPRVGGMSEFSK